MNRTGRLTLLSLVTLLATSCASPIPELIKNPPLKTISIKQVQKDATSYIDKKVRWGGSILSVDNKKDKTVVELLARPLSESGQPNADDPGIGRFLATIDGFIEPTEFPLGRLLTVTGTLTESVTQPVKEYPYRYPVVEIESLHLWPQPQNYQDIPPYYWDPYFDPWYPWRYRPHYR